MVLLPRRHGSRRQTRDPHGEHEVDLAVCDALLHEGVLDRARNRPTLAGRPSFFVDFAPQALHRRLAELDVSAGR